MGLNLLGALIVGGGARALCLLVLYVRIAMALSKAVALCGTAYLGLHRLVVLWCGLVLIWVLVVVLSGRCHGWQCKDGDQS